jgi:hypothetical protein
MASGKPQDTAPKPSGKKAGKLSQKDQSERFKEIARMLEVDESGLAFDQAFKKLSAIIPLTGRKEPQ